MLVALVSVTIYLAGSAVLADLYLDKPFYDVEDAANLFKDYVKEYKKDYNRREYMERQDIFKQSLKEINERNDMFPLTVFGVNRFADLKLEERQRNLGSDSYTPLNLTLSGKWLVLKNSDIPIEDPYFFDWRDKHVITRVKNEGACDASYIFSAIGNIEAHYAMQYNECLTLSEGQALDCLKVGSCYGGVMISDRIIHELAQRQGVLQEKDYPYNARKGKCHEDFTKKPVKVKGYIQLKHPFKEEDIKKFLLKTGPVSVALNPSDMSFYQSGILGPCECKGKPPTREMLLVGYGEENGVKFWTLKNSWGESWGEKGYLRLLRGVDACKVETSYAVQAVVDPPELKINE